MNFLREGDTLVITRLDRLARSVVPLAQLAKRFEKEKINLIVIYQKIDTSTSTGRLMLNMLASIAEFENDLRTERQAEGVAKAKEMGGQPNSTSIYVMQYILAEPKEPRSVNFELGEATIYRALKMAVTKRE